VTQNTKQFNSVEDMVGWYVDLSDEVSTEAFCKLCDKFGITSLHTDIKSGKYADDCINDGYPYMCVLKDSNIIHLDAFYSDYPNNKYTMNEFKASQEAHTEVLSQKMNNHTPNNQNVLELDLGLFKSIKQLQDKLVELNLSTMIDATTISIIDNDTSREYIIHTEDQFDKLIKAYSFLRELVE
jgi:predicted  nucleic acid-binding Zn-ribbon protein